MAKRNSTVAGLSAGERDALAARGGIDPALNGTPNAAETPAVPPTDANAAGSGDAGTNGAETNENPANAAETPKTGWDRGTADAGCKRSHRIFEVAGFRGDPVAGYTRTFPDGSKLILEPFPTHGAAEGTVHYEGQRIDGYGEAIGTRSFPSLAAAAAGVCKSLAGLIPAAE